MSNAIIECQKLYKSYHDGTSFIQVLNDIDFNVQPADKIAIVGPSGSGKSTLLHLLGGLDKPSQGSVLIENENWQQLSEKKRCRIRNQKLGFIYQFHHLLPEFTALENVAMPILLSGCSLDEAYQKSCEMLDKVGLAAREKHKPSQLSGGERQRVAIARALVHKPQCVLADEPTGNLDQQTAGHVFDLMLTINEQIQTSLIIVTHDSYLADKMDQILMLQDGKLVRKV